MPGSSRPDSPIVAVIDRLPWKPPHMSLRPNLIVENVKPLVSRLRQRAEASV